MSEFREFIENKRTWYQSIGRVFCPVLNEDVVFNSQGFRHLRYNGLGKERNKEQQKSRMNLLHLVSSIIKTCGKISEYRQHLKDGKNVEYWRLEQPISKNYLVDIVLRRIGSGNVTFYSIWNKRK